MHQISLDLILKLAILVAVLGLFRSNRRYVIHSRLDVKWLYIMSMAKWLMVCGVLVYVAYHVDLEGLWQGTSGYLEGIRKGF